MTATVEERVAAGIEFLDASGPANWREKIDLERLDLRKSTKCILGQLFGGGQEWWHTVREHFNLTEAEATGMGFNGNRNSDHSADCKLLTAEWKRRLGPPPALTITRDQLHQLVDIADASIFRSLTVELGGAQVTVTV